MTGQEHWNTVYRTKPHTSVSWYQSTPAPTLSALDRLGAMPEASLIDIGGGASLLVDALAARSWNDLTVLDISAEALAVARARTEASGQPIFWVVADITEWQPDRTYDFWHDRAVFHFLTDPKARAGYRRALLTALAPGGIAVVATFAPDGPEKCSGLPVRRYDAAGIAGELGAELRLVDSWREIHRTPSGTDQAFTWAVLRRNSTISDKQ